MRTYAITWLRLASNDIMGGANFIIDTRLGRRLEWWGTNKKGRHCVARVAFLHHASSQVDLQLDASHDKGFIYCHNSFCLLVLCRRIFKNLAKVASKSMASWGIFITCSILNYQSSYLILTNLKTENETIWKFHTIRSHTSKVFKRASTTLWKQTKTRDECGILRKERASTDKGTK